MTSLATNGSKVKNFLEPAIFCHLAVLMQNKKDPRISLIKSRFSLFGTKLARNQQENYPIFVLVFRTKNARKVSKS